MKCWKTFLSFWQSSLSLASLFHVVFNPDIEPYTFKRYHRNDTANNYTCVPVADGRNDRTPSCVGLSVEAAEFLFHSL